jgi:hypothetical protein
MYNDGSNHEREQGASTEMALGFFVVFGVDQPVPEDPEQNSENSLSIARQNGTSIAGR